jgi:hypothetical protein
MEPERVACFLRLVYEIVHFSAAEGLRVTAEIDKIPFAV